MKMNAASHALLKSVIEFLTLIFIFSERFGQNSVPANYRWCLSLDMGFVKIGTVKARLYLRALFCLISYVFRPIQIQFFKENVHRNVFHSTRARENRRCENHTLRTDVGLNKFLFVPSTFTVRFWWKSVQENAHNGAEIGDNRRREGHIFLTDANEITFTRLPWNRTSKKWESLDTACEICHGYTIWNLVLSWREAIERDIEAFYSKRSQMLRLHTVNVRWIEIWVWDTGRAYCWQRKTEDLGNKPLSLSPCSP
jgi:hypothetical protein